MIAAATSSLEWVLRPPPPETAVRALMARTGWPWAVCALLVQRDLTDLEALRRFLRPRVDHFEPPERLAVKDSLKGAKFIKAATSATRRFISWGGSPRFSRPKAISASTWV